MMFLQTTLNFADNIYETLAKSANFEHITNGRTGAVLVEKRGNDIPIVRTTTVYKNGATKFLPIHHQIIDQIKTGFPTLQLDFNNALIEIYDQNYRTMGGHSDQALDLDNNSYIAVFSCYDKPTSIRTLHVENKTTKEKHSLVLNQYLVVLFSTQANKNHLHRIVLEPTEKIPNKWLGITFRLSTTYIKFFNEIPYFLTHDPLILANNSQRKEFYLHRSLENRNIDYDYPRINYTISPSDLLPV